MSGCDNDNNEVCSVHRETAASVSMDRKETNIHTYMCVVACGIYLFVKRLEIESAPRAYVHTYIHGIR